MKAPVALAFVTSAVLLTSVILRADSWSTPRPLVFASSYGYYGFKTEPPQPFVLNGRAQGTLFTLAEDGREQVLWRRELVNIPVRALVTDDGKHVVTLDTWTRMGYEHTLVIYGEGGSVVADHNLEAFLSADEIAKSIVHTVGSRHWLQGGSIAIDEGWDSVSIRFQWGKAVRLILSTGRIEAIP
jgi:hypothetical protein